MCFEVNAKIEKNFKSPEIHVVSSYIKILLGKKYLGPGEFPNTKPRQNTYTRMCKIEEQIFFNF